jgi:hypothetical protein
MTEMFDDVKVIDDKYYPKKYLSCVINLGDDVFVEYHVNLVTGKNLTVCVHERYGWAKQIAEIGGPYV